MHVLGYKWDGGAPKLKIFENNEIRYIGLFDLEFRWRVGRRKCIGYWNGKYVPCPTGETVRGTRCESCKRMDKFFYCLKCDGSECLNPKRRDECKEEEYVVYITVFGDILKVGISQTFRKTTRWLEQGADFAAEVRNVKDGMLARRIESAISKRLGIVDRVRGNEKIGKIFSDPNISLQMLRRAVEVLNGFGSRYIIHDLRSNYRLENVKGKPKEASLSAGSVVKGKVVAVKGNLMIFEDGNETRYINLHRLTGRELETGLI